MFNNSTFTFISVECCINKYGEFKNQNMKNLSYTQHTWVPVSENPNYEVSSLGAVRHTADQQLVKLNVHTAGYWTLYIRGINGKKGHAQYLHILVATAFHENPEHKPEVNHLDGDKQNCAWWNLAFATRKENNDHALNTGLCAFEKPVFDTATGIYYRSIHEAARASEFAHRTLNRWLVEGRNNRSTMVLV